MALGQGAVVVAAAISQTKALRGKADAGHQKQFGQHHVGIAVDRRAIPIGQQAGAWRPAQKTQGCTALDNLGQRDDHPMRVPGIERGAQVRLVLHPELADRAPLMERCRELEREGARIKIAPRNMHEKFVIIDEETLINSSANFSLGARTKYSENIIFVRKPESRLLQALREEFALLWDSSRDLISNGEPLEALLGGAAQHPIGNPKDSIQFHSSSFNLEARPNKPESAAALAGKALALRLKKDQNSQEPWAIRDLLIASIDQAKVRVDCAFNHFNIREIADALLRAAARGVEIRLNVDQQEYKDAWHRDDIEMTPYFVEHWQKANPGKTPPVRVKTYSLEPTPAFWLLNHHKFLLIDHAPGKPLLPSTVLLSGSYNLSKTAEHSQFDNMIEFRGAENGALMQAFQHELDRLWSWGRAPSDTADSDKLTRWSAPAQDGTLALHFGEAQSLSWPELQAFRARVRVAAPGLLEQLNRTTAECSRYHTGRKQFTGCPERR